MRLKRKFGKTLNYKTFISYRIILYISTTLHLNRLRENLTRQHRHIDRQYIRID